MNLAAPATDPAGYTFSQWTLNGAAQPDGQKSITFTMDAAVTAVAHYTANRLHAVRAVRAAAQAGHHVEHVRRRHDELQGVQCCVRHERESPSAGDGPGRVYLLAMDGGRRGAEPGQKSVTFTMAGAATALAEYMAERRLRTDRAIHTAKRDRYHIEHGPERHDELHEGQRGLTGRA